MAKNRRQKVPKSDFQSRFSTSKIIRIFLKKISLENINLGAHFLFLSILCTMKIERLLFLKFLKKLAFFDSYFWPFNKSHEKTNAIFMISAIMASIWNVFIKFRWHDEKLTTDTCSGGLLSPFILRRRAILSSLKIMIIFTNTSADIKTKSADLLSKMIIILSELRIAQLCP